MRKEGNMMFRWQLSEDKDDAIMNYMLPNHYETEAPLRVDCGMFDPPDPLPKHVPDVRKDLDSIKDVLDKYIQKLLDYKGFYKIKNILVPYGGDFWFSDHARQI